MFSEAELDRLRRFPDAIGADELIRFFTLMPGDVMNSPLTANTQGAAAVG